MKLTPTAVDHLKALLDQPDPKLIKVGVRNRGCSGLAYHLEFVDKAGAFDEAVEQDGVRVLIDSKALFSILGSEMDWVEDKLSQRFVFRNPNISEYSVLLFLVGCAGPVLTCLQRSSADVASRSWYDGRYSEGVGWENDSTICARQLDWTGARGVGCCQSPRT